MRRSESVGLLGRLPTCVVRIRSLLVFIWMLWIDGDGEHGRWRVPLRKWHTFSRFRDPEGPEAWDQVPPLDSEGRAGGPSLQRRRARELSQRKGGRPDLRPGPPTRDGLRPYASGDLGRWLARRRSTSACPAGAGRLASSFAASSPICTPELRPPPNPYRPSIAGRPAWAIEPVHASPWSCLAVVRHTWLARPCAPFWERVQ